ncbi:hypothetical protein Pme01_51020 [Planosporangium mesophilum]|uniref:Uncharacterized protein n=2 Tax=Planosporangium mesophilum TaxID=689768 RepID=A0A8J3X2J0_9ACTN|nr:hypothetical protein Pme01_51020 [Planosporangium mesophilum]
MARRGLAVLAGWYALAVVVPIALATLLFGPEFVGLGPERVGPYRTCTEKTLACWTGPSVSDLLGIVVPFLLVSLAISLPAYWFLVRRPGSAVYAGTVAAFGGWVGCAWLACAVSALLRS